MIKLPRRVSKMLRDECSPELADKVTQMVREYCEEVSKERYLTRRKVKRLRAALEKRTPPEHRVAHALRLVINRHGSARLYRQLATGELICKSAENDEFLEESGDYEILGTYTAPLDDRKVYLDILGA